MTDDAALYWHSPAPAHGSGAQRLFTMPRTGGAPSEVPTPLRSGESVWAMARHADGRMLVALGPRDNAVTDEVILYRVPLPAGSASPTRASLGRTYLEGLAVAFDDASVYFTVDASDPSDDISLETRTLYRTCLGGSAVVPLLIGVRCGDATRCSSSPSMTPGSTSLQITASTPSASDRAARRGASTPFQVSATF